MDDYIGMTDTVSIKIIPEKKSDTKTCATCFAKIGNQCVTSGIVVDEYFIACEHYDPE